MSAVLKAGTVTADRAPVGTEFQSWIADGKYECVCSGVGDLELVFVPPGVADSGLKQTCSGVYINKAVHDFVHYADLA